MRLGHKLSALATLASGVARTSRRSGISPAALLRSYRQFRWATGASPAEFFCYRLWDPRIPIEDRLAFTTWAQRRPLEAYMNPKAAADQVQSKLNGDRRFREIGLATPALLGVWYPTGAAGDHVLAIRSRDALVAVLERCSDGLVCKREYGGSGEFVRVFAKADGTGVQRVSGEEWSLDRLIAEMVGTQPWLLQQRLRAHPEVIRLIGGDELASVRLVTCRRHNGHTFLLPAMLKLPATNTGLDNLSAGNVAVAVLADGTLGSGVSGFLGEPIAMHPRSGVHFAGFRVPHWEAAVAMALDSHQHFPALTSLGWDVAITPDGPVMLEANAWWGDAVQHPGPRGLISPEFLEYVEELGATHLLTLDHRRRLAQDQRAPSRPAKSTTSP